MSTIRQPALRTPSVIMAHPVVWNMGMKLIQVESTRVRQPAA